MPSTSIIGKSSLRISISADGTVLAIGAYGNDAEDGTDSQRGHVRVYKFSNNSWSQLGTDIEGDDEGDAFGFDTALSSDGTILAASGWYAKGDGANTSDPGHVKVFQYSNSTWSQIGSDIEGENVADRFGLSIDLSLIHI